MAGGVMNGSVFKVGKQMQYGSELVVGPGMWLWL